MDGREPRAATPVTTAADPQPMSRRRRLILGVLSLAFGAGGLAAAAGVVLGWWPSAAAPASVALLVACEAIPLTTRAGLQRRVMLTLVVAAVVVALGVDVRSGWPMALAVAVATGELRSWRRAIPRNQPSVSTITRVVGLATLVLAGMVAFVLRVDDSIVVALLLTAVAAYLIADGPGWNVSARW